MKILWIIIAFVCGLFLPVQAGLNNRLGKAIESPVYATMFTFGLGAIAALAYILLTRQHVAWSGVKTAPAYSWLAGVMGVFYATGVTLAFHRIGAALTFGLVVTGQMMIALLLDHFNILVAQQHGINIWRILGVLLILSGVVIIRKF